MKENKAEFEDSFLLNELEEEAQNSEFEEHKSKFKPNFNEPIEEEAEDFTQEQEDVENGFEIDGEFAVEIMDILLSRVGAFGMTLAKMPSHFKDFQLTAGEKRTLAPLIEKWLEHEQFNVSPRTALIGTLITIYGAKGFTQYQKLKEAKKEGKEEEVKKKATRNKGGRPKGAKDKKPRKTPSRKKQEEQTEKEDKNA